MAVLGGQYTPETIARRRKLAQSLTQKAIGSAPRNLGEGLASIGSALAARGINNRLDEQETEGRASADRLFPAMQEGERTEGIGGLDRRLIDAASNPFLSAGQKAIVNAMMQRDFTSQDRSAESEEFDRRFGMRRDADLETLGLQQNFTGEQNALNRASRGRDAPSGYQFAPDGSLAPIVGGPADPANKPPVVSFGQKALDQAFAKEYAAAIAQGSGFDTAKMVNELDGVLNQLNSGAELTGPITGRTPDFINSIVNPGAIAARDAVSGVVQRNLKTILGAQFTQKEGENLIARAYNPLLSEEENALRVGRLLTQMKLAAAQKQAALEHFNANGTLAGFQGVANYSMADFEAALDNEMFDPRNDSPPNPRGPQEGLTPEERAELEELERRFGQ